MEIEVGQVWRARWAATTVLVLITAVEPQHVSVVPVTLDPPAESAACLVVDGTRTAFGAEATVWGDLGRTFPPLSCVYLFYRVAPNHVFCAVVESIKDAVTP